MALARRQLPGAFIAREKRLGARAECDNAIGLGRRSLDFHSRRADRYARHGKTRRLRPVAQQVMDCICGNVTFDNVILGFGGLAGGERRQRAKLPSGD